jgi:hypothetical protein
MSYVEIPVILKWSPKRQTGFRIGAGPSLGIITGAHDRYEATTAAGTPYVLEQDVEGQLTSLDAGLSAEVEWRFPILSIAARYIHGLTDITGSGVKTRTADRYGSDLPRQEEGRRGLDTLAADGPSFGPWG